MISLLIKSGEEQNLAKLSVVLPLATMMCLLLPGTLIIAPLQLFLPEQFCLLVLFVFLIAWFVFVVAMWIRAIKLIRLAHVRNVSTVVFHLLQIGGIILGGMRIFFAQENWNFFFMWLVCLDVALVAFYLSYFTLATCTFTKIPWHAVTGFLIVCLTLDYEFAHNPFAGLGF